MATRQECIEKATHYAERAATILETADAMSREANTAGFIPSPQDDETLRTLVAGAQAFAAVSQAWSALHEMQFGQTVRMDRA